MNNSNIIHKNGKTHIFYYETPIVSFNDSIIILDNGHYYTVSTKNRMNLVSEQYGLEFKVFQSNKKWFVEYKGIKYNFTEYMQREGRLILSRK